MAATPAVCLGYNLIIILLMTDIRITKAGPEAPPTAVMASAAHIDPPPDILKRFPLIQAAAAAAACQTPPPHNGETHKQLPLVDSC